jgi:hypothetical protein
MISAIERKSWQKMWIDEESEALDFITKPAIRGTSLDKINGSSMK